MTPPSVMGGVRLALDRSAALLRDVSRLGLRVAEAVEQVGRGHSAAPAPALQPAIPDVPGGPPADWLAKVRAGAPHLLEPGRPVQSALPPLPAAWPDRPPTDQQAEAWAEAEPTDPASTRPLRDNLPDSPSARGRHRLRVAAEPAASNIPRIESRGAGPRPAPSPSTRQPEQSPASTDSPADRAAASRPSAPSPTAPRRAAIAPRLLPLNSETPEPIRLPRPHGGGASPAAAPLVRTAREPRPFVRLVPVAMGNPRPGRAETIVASRRPDPAPRLDPAGWPVLEGPTPRPPHRAADAPTTDTRRPRRSQSHVPARPPDARREWPGQWSSEQPHEGTVVTASDRWAPIDPASVRPEAAPSPTWPSLPPAAAYAQLDPLEESAAHQRTADRARFLRAEQERWS